MQPFLLELILRLKKQKRPQNLLRRRLKRKKGGTFSPSIIGVANSHREIRPGLDQRPDDLPVSEGGRQVQRRLPERVGLEDEGTPGEERVRHPAVPLDRGDVERGGVGGVAGVRLGAALKEDPEGGKEKKINRCIGKEIPSKPPPQGELQAG